MMNTLKRLDNIIGGLNEGTGEYRSSVRFLGAVERKKIGHILAGFKTWLQVNEITSTEIPVSDVLESHFDSKIKNDIVWKKGRFTMLEKLQFAKRDLDVPGLLNCFMKSRQNEVHETTGGDYLIRWNSSKSESGSLFVLCILRDFISDESRDARGSIGFIALRSKPLQIFNQCVSRVHSVRDVVNALYYFDKTIAPVRYLSELNMVGKSGIYDEVDYWSDVYDSRVAQELYRRLPENETASIDAADGLGSFVDEYSQSVSSVFLHKWDRNFWIDCISIYFRGDVRELNEKEKRSMSERPSVLYSFVLKETTRAMQTVIIAVIEENHNDRDSTGHFQVVTYELPSE